MKISEITIFRGPSLYGRRPMIRLRLDLASLKDWPTDRLGPGFLDRLEETIELLRECPGWNGKGGIRSRMTKGESVFLAEVFAEAAIALQRSVGAKVSQSAVRPLQEPEVFEVAFEFRAAAVGQVVGEAAIAHLIEALPAETGLKNQVDPGEIRKRIRNLARNRGLLDASTFRLIEAAEARGVPWNQISDRRRLLRLGYGIRQKRISGMSNSDMDPVAALIARDKLVTGSLLKKAGIPVPRQFVAGSLAQARQAAARLGYPLVVKPRDMGKGYGVYPGVSDDRKLKLAFETVRKIRPSVMIEEFIPGNDHRLLVIGGKLVAAARRIPAQVVGDGKNTIRELIRIENENPLRREGDGLVLMPMLIDEEVESLLGDRGLSLETVPAEGEAVFLRQTANVSTGGTAVDVTNSVHPDNRDLAERAAELAGLNVAGVDLICPDISVSFRETGGAITEINETPGLGGLHWVPDQENQDSAGALIDLLFPSAEDSGIPIASVTGTDGKTTTCRMLAAILSETGQTVGLAVTDGVEIDGELTKAGDGGGAKGARTVLFHPKVEAAVLETARGGILRQGIAFDRCDVGAVTNIGRDHLGDEGVETIEELARVKRLVVELATKSAVLNADDDLCREMIPFVTAAHLCLVSLDQTNPALAEHIKLGRRAVYLEGDPADGWVVICNEGKETRVIRSNEIPATLNGVAKHNLQNALFATAMAYGMDVGPDVIQSALSQFTCSFEDTPGRLNFFDGFPFQVLLDYGHNAGEVGLISDMVQELPVEGRRICFLTAPGNRRDEDIEAIGRAAAGKFDHYICGNRGDLRGREPDFVPGTIRRSLLENGVKVESAVTITNAEEGIVKALEAGAPGDLVLIFNRNFRLRKPLIESLRERLGSDKQKPSRTGSGSA